MLKGVLGLLVGTLTFAFSLLRRIETRFVPDIGITLAEALLVVGLVIFVVFLNRFVHRLRPVAVTALVAKALREGLDSDIAAMRDVRGVFAGPVEGMDESPAVEVRCSRPGAVQAVNLPKVAAWASQHESLVVMQHSVGEFVETGDLLFEVYGNPGQADAARDLRGLVALGLERTIEQDSAFALRVMVDVANKALSPAVNDPTTAVQVLDYLGDSLRVMGEADLSGPSRHTSAHRRGVVVPVRRWEDFLALGITEIREFGSTSIQVMRRLRAVLEELLHEVRPANRAEVLAEIERLDATVAAGFSGSTDRDWAGIADRQGLGGPDRLGHAEPPAG